jgi:hypothetical protein
MEGLALSSTRMVATDRTSDGVTILRSTKTDAKGYFRFSTQGGKSVYCIRFDRPLWNPLQVTVRLDKHEHQRGITVKDMVVGGLSANVTHVEIEGQTAQVLQKSHFAG